MVIKIILKKGGCLDCIDICDKHGDDKNGDDDKTKKLNSLISKVKKEITNYVKY